jgi:tetratricopeptide (TPR) repeat protein/predicted Ser/Thr protein kinase
MLAIGQQIAQFKVLARLGEGGMGAVYLAEDANLGRRVALKVLPREFTDDPERGDRFQREARTAAGINDPGVMGIYEIGEVEIEGRRVRYIVMEYVPGEPLDRYLNSREPGMAEILRLGEKIASGLAAAHRLGIVHRDIKPGNIIVTEEHHPKILDFGLAKQAEGPLQPDEEPGETVTVDRDLTQAGKIIGTVTYMSPEQAQGEKLDTRSDIFSFGVLLYRMLTGATPFAGPTQVSTLAKIIEAPHASARTRNEAVHPELERIIDKCLQKRPEDRYQDTRDLVADLRRLRRQYDSGITDSSASGEHTAVGAAPAGSTQWWPRVAAGVLILGVVAAGWLVLRRGEDGVAVAGETRLAVLNFENRTGDEELAWMATGLPDILLTDLSRCDGLSLISRERVDDYADKTRDDPMTASRKLGATSVLTGSYFKAGDRIRIDARLQDPASGEILFAQKVMGTDAFTLVDSLSALVVAELHVAPDTPMPRVAEMLTTTPEAYKFYHLGDEQLLRNDFEAAREYYEKSLAEDSTFALPYMRIGMTHVFESRMTLGQVYLRRALEYKDTLTPRDRSMLDVYADVWVNQQFGDAYAKLEALANAYPDDKEILTIHAAVLVGFAADTTRGFALLERVLDLDEDFTLAATFYGQELQRFRQYERAIELYERLIERYPDVEEYYEAAGDCHLRLGEFDEARAAYEGYYRRFPDQTSILPDLAGMAIRSRNFDEAREYAERFAELEKDDPVNLRRAEYLFQNLDNWHGRFESALGHARESVRLARSIRDSLQIGDGLGTLAVWFDRFGEPDSAVAYFRRAREHVNPVNRLQYTAESVAVDPGLGSRLRPQMVGDVEVFKTRTPQPLWYLADHSITAFDLLAARDTAGTIEHLKGMLDLPAAHGGGNENTKRKVGKLLARTGRHEEALPYLREGIGGEVPSSDAWVYLDMTYWIGRCEEALGRVDRAAERYREVLRFWDDADIEIEALRGAREGLNRLAS